MLLLRLLPALTCATILSLTASLAAGDIDAGLRTVLDETAPDTVVSALVYLDLAVDSVALTAELDLELATLATRHEAVLRELRWRAEASQPRLDPLRANLEASASIVRWDPYWIVNAIRVDGTPAALRMLAAHPDVDRVFLNPAIEPIRPVVVAGDDAAVPGPLAGGPEAGVMAVRAPEVWDLGFTGEGVLVGIIDTGVDGNHAALASRWAGLGSKYEDHPEWAWFDPFLGENDFPYDDGGHGTHVMGTVCGGLPGDQIGVAPGATWIAAGAIDRGGSINETIGDIIQALQWIVDPDGDPTTTFDVPATCSNSWGLATINGIPECDETFWAFIDNVEAAGILVVFAAGNEGPTGLRRPGDRAIDDFRSTAIGAFNAESSGWPIANFSSTGPTFCTPGGTAAIKPELAAPGVGVRSARAGGGYIEKNGTSMAAPHVNGVVALMRQANPDLSVQQIKTILFDTAIDHGAPGDDNEYGHGAIDAYEAVLAALDTVSLTFTFPAGRPAQIDPNGGTVMEVAVSGQSAQPAPGSGRLHYRIDDGPFQSFAMTEVEANVYLASFPSFPCASVVSYYISARTVQGDVATHPFTAPTGTHSTIAVTGTMVAYATDFEDGDGWSVTEVDLDDGEWERGVPAGNGERGDPTSDADGSGQCWVTGNEPGNSDVDGGPTILISPVIDATELPDPVLKFSYWFANDDGDLDDLDVDFSDDGGDSWTPVVSYGAGLAWVGVSLRVQDYVDVTSEFRVRFSATDNPNDSVTEAGIDAVRLISFYCDLNDLPGDVNGDGAVGFEDIVILLADWGPCPGCVGDLDGDGVVGFGDLLIVLSNYGA